MPRRSSGCLRRANACVDFYPVVSHLRMHDFARRFRDDDIGLLNWHMAVNATVLNLVSTQFSQHAAALPLVAGETFK